MSVRSVIDSNRRKNSNLLQFPENLGHHGMLMVFRKYEFRRPGTRGILTSASVEPTITNSIFLPLPANLTDIMDINIERFDLGILGESIANEISKIAGASENGLLLSNVVKSALSAIPVNTDKIAKAISSGDFTDLSRDAAFLARSSLSGNLTRNVDAGVGNTPNPKSALMFGGVTLKPHNFTWSFMPKSQNESELLKQIITLIRQNTLPTYGEGLGLERVYLNYPSTVDIFLFGVDETHFLKYKTSMVRSVEINYTPDGRISLLKGGKPAAVQVSMSMLEMDIHTAEDYL